MSYRALPLAYRTASLPVSNTAEDLPLDLIELGMRGRARIPREFPVLTRSAEIKEDQLVLKLKGRYRQLWDIREFDFIPEEELVFDIQSPPEMKRFLWGRRLIIRLLPEREKDPDALRGVLSIRPSSPKSAQTQYFYINQSIDQ